MLRLQFSCMRGRSNPGSRVLRKPRPSEAQNRAKRCVSPAQHPDKILAAHFVSQRCKAPRPSIRLHRALMIKCRKTQLASSSRNFELRIRFWLWLALVCLGPLGYLHFAMTLGSGSARSSFPHRSKLSRMTLCMCGLSMDGCVKSLAVRPRTLDTKL